MKISHSIFLWLLGFSCFLIPLGVRVSHTPGWLQNYYVAKDGLELLVLLPLPPVCWVHSQVPPHLALLGELSKNFLRFIFIHVFACE